MTKVTLIGCHDVKEFVTQINNFIKDKKVIDIKYQSHVYNDTYNFRGIPDGARVVNQALIIYEE